MTKDQTDLKSLPPELFSEVISLAVNPNQTSTRTVERGTQLMCNLFGVNKVTRAVAEDTLALTRIVALEYVGPKNLAPDIHCSVFESDVPTRSVIKFLNCADIGVTISKSGVPASGQPIIYRLTLAEFKRYIARVGAYLSPFPPRFLSELERNGVTASELEGFHSDYDIAVIAAWIPRTLKHEGVVQEQPIQRTAVEDDLLRAWDALVPLLSWSSRSYVTMPKATPAVKEACERLVKDAAVKGSDLPVDDWLAERVEFFKSDYTSCAKKYNDAMEAGSEGDNFDLSSFCVHSIATFRLADIADDLASKPYDFGIELGPVLNLAMKGCVAIDVIDQRHILDTGWLDGLGRPVICDVNTCPCAIVKRGIICIRVRDLERGNAPMKFGHIEPQVWARVQYRVALNHHGVKESRGLAGIEQCIADLKRITNGDGVQVDERLKSDLLSDIRAFEDARDNYNSYMSSPGPENPLWREGEDSETLESLLKRWRLRQGQKPWTI